MKSSIFTTRSLVLGWVIALAYTSCDSKKTHQTTATHPSSSAGKQNSKPDSPAADATAAKVAGVRIDVDVNALLSDPLAADRSLPVPLLAVGDLNAAEDAALAKCLAEYRLTAADGDLSPLERFLAAFPQGMRAHALRNNLAQLYYSKGEFSKSYVMWNEAWSTSKNLQSPIGKLMADDAFAGLSRLLVLFGRKEDLSSLLAMVSDRPLGGTAMEGQLQAKEALGSMENWQEQAFKCGPFALFRIRAQLGLPEPLHPLIEAEKSTVKGT
ncbi:MAG: hypothetical protein ABI600_02430, partial [Luteolibacter sp.]